MGIFKAYDIRGVYGDDINEDIVYRIARAYVQKFKPKKVTVGMDGRVSSPSLFKELVRGITDEGCDVLDIGLVTTPMMYFSAWNYDVDGGLMVSASHNPPRYNGVKMVKRDAVPIGGETGIYEIGEMIDKLHEPKAKKGSVKMLELMQDYVNNSLRYNIRKLKKFNIVIDTANAVGGPVASEFFKRIDCQLTHLFPEIDGTFPNHEANPLKEENLMDLKRTVLIKNADIGIAFDGDADRCGFVDELGQTVQSDLVVALVAKELLEEKKGQKILFDIRCSKIVGDIIRENKGIAGRCKVGHALVKPQMRKEGARFAGELSSHFYLADEHYAEAPFFVILKILEMMTKTNKKLSELIAPLRRYHQSGEINSEVKDKEAKMRELAMKFKDGRQSTLDGLSVEYDTWWFNVRPSNTEPYLRLNVEADTKELMEEKRDMVLNLIRG